MAESFGNSEPVEYAEHNTVEHIKLERSEAIDTGKGWRVRPTSVEMGNNEQSPYLTFHADISWMTQQDKTYNSNQTFHYWQENDKLMHAGGHGLFAWNHEINEGDLELLGQFLQQVSEEDAYRIMDHLGIFSAEPETTYQEIDAL